MSREFKSRVYSYSLVNIMTALTDACACNVVDEVAPHTTHGDWQQRVAENSIANMCYTIQDNLLKGIRMFCVSCAYV